MKSMDPIDFPQMRAKELFLKFWQNSASRMLLFVLCLFFSNIVPTTAHAIPQKMIAAFSAVLDKNPQDITARKGRIDAYLADNQYDKATEDIKILLAYSPQSSFALSRLGHIHFAHKHDPEIGGVYYDQAIKNEPDRSLKKQYFFTRGQHYQEFGMHRRAIQDFSEALACDPLFEKALIARSESRLKLRRRKAADGYLMPVENSPREPQSTNSAALIREYLKTLQKNASQNNKTASQTPTSSKELQHIQSKKVALEQARGFLIEGAQYFYEGNLEEASMLLHRVLSLDPEQAQAYYLLGQIAEKSSEDHVRTAVYYQRAYSIDPGAVEYRSSFAYTLYLQEKFNQAAAILSHSIKEKKSKAADYYLRALCRQQIGNQKEALVDLKEAIKRDAGLTFINRFEEHFVLKADRTKKLSSWKPFKEIAVSNKAVDEDTQQSQSSIVANGFTDKKIEQIIKEAKEFFKQKRLKEAKINFFKAVELSPNNSEPFHLLGKLFSTENNDRKALLYFNQAIDRDNSKSAYYFDRGQVLYKLNAFESAKKDFSAALQIAPGTARFLFNRGNCFLRLGYRQSALADYRKLTALSDEWKNKIKAQLRQFP